MGNFDNTHKLLNLTKKLCLFVYFLGGILTLLVAYGVLEEFEIPLVVNVEYLALGTALLAMAVTILNQEASK